MANDSLYIALLSCGTALLINALLWIDARSAVIGNVYEVRRIKNLMITGVMQSIAYFAEHILHGWHFFESRMLGMFLQSMIVLANMLFLLAYADFVFYRYKRESHSVTKKRLLFFAPLYLAILLDIVNVFTPVFFDMTAGDLMYVETPFIWYVNLMPVVYLLFAAVFDVRNWKKKSRFVNLFISLYYLPGLLGVGMEHINPDIPAIPIFCAISITTMYLHILKQVGYIDRLSGLLTRTPLSLYIDSVVNTSPTPKMLAGIMMDLDRFKRINDTYGHVAGDRAIQLVGSILSSVTRKEDMCFRYGGDEFIVIMKVTDAAHITRQMEAIDVAVAQANAENSLGFDVSLSQGYAIYDVRSDTVESFIERMDGEMYKNKQIFRSKEKNVQTEGKA